VATNNQAEYYGFKKGLERARDLGIDKISLYSDSQLVVNQMNGLYKVKNQELAPLHQDVKKWPIRSRKLLLHMYPGSLIN
jgi:ribonuclease HI